MASDRLAELLRKRSAFTEDEVKRMTEREAWQWIHAAESYRLKELDTALHSAGQCSFDETFPSR